MKFPHIVTYTNNFEPLSVAGRANGPFVRIRPQHKDDAGLHAHEYEHVRQWYLTLFLHPLLYRFIRRYRKSSEARAFAAQVRHGADLYAMARRMAGAHYDLRISDGAARLAIQKYV